MPTLLAKIDRVLFAINFNSLTTQDLITHVKTHHPASDRRTLSYLDRP